MAGRRLAAASCMLVISFTWAYAVIMSCDAQVSRVTFVTKECMLKFTMIVAESS